MVIRIYMAMSGNVGDTLNVLPVLSGIYKASGHSISLVINDKMKIFNGIKELLSMQECICEVKYKSEINLDNTCNTLSLVDDFQQHLFRPWETVRLEEYFKRHYSLEFNVDDDFVLDVPDIEFDDTKFLVGDRMYHPMMDQRRKFLTLKDSGKFNLDKIDFLDYNVPMHINAARIAKTTKPIFTTFTGISVIGDLLQKEQVVLWGDDIRNWDNKPIEYSFNKHFYRDRNSKLMYLGDFNMNNYEDVNEI